MEDINENNDEDYGCCAYILIGLSYFVFILTFPLAIFVCVKVRLKKNWSKFTKFSFKLNYYLISGRQGI